MVHGAPSRALYLARVAEDDLKLQGILIFARSVPLLSLTGNQPWSRDPWITLTHTVENLGSCGLASPPPLAGVWVHGPAQLANKSKAIVSPQVKALATGKLFRVDRCLIHREQSTISIVFMCCPTPRGFLKACAFEAPIDGTLPKLPSVVGWCRRVGSQVPKICLWICRYCDGIVKLRRQELQSVKLQVLDREQKFVGQLARDDAPASHS